MSNRIHLQYLVSGDDFTRAGEASSNVKSKLKQMGIDPKIVRKVAIAMYEGDISAFLPPDVVKLVQEKMISIKKG